MKKFIQSYQGYIATGITTVIIALVTSQNILLSDFGYETEMKSFYNNYLIFKHSFFHLLENTDLYGAFPEIVTDRFKYSPTFSLFFGIFAYLPDFVGLFLWNALNGLVFFALWQLRFDSVNNKIWIWAFVLLEFITNIQNSQSNGLVAGLMILGYVFLERKNVLLATLMIVLTVYIKLFGLVAFALFLLYPNKWKAIGYTILWSVVLFALPLVVVPFNDLIQQYYNWFELLKTDQPVEFSLSVLGWLKYWFNFVPNNLYVLGVGAAILLAPFQRTVQYKNHIFRQLILASILVWVVLFNHKAESPTFIIAIAGVAIWLFSQKFTIPNKVLLVMVLLFTQLAQSDLYPAFIRENYFIPYVIKVVPIILVWLKIQNDIFSLEGFPEEESSDEIKI